MKTISLQANVPQQLSLEDPSGILDGNEVHYQTSCGRTLTLPYSVACRLNALDLKPGEAFIITKQISGRMVSFDIRLAGESERDRAIQEAPELERQLSESLEALRRIPTRAGTGPSKGTGTHGPAPLPAPVQMPRIAAKADRQQPPGRVSYRIALRDITATVKSLLDETGEQWADQAKQDLISTAFISATKAGMVVFDFQGEGR